MKYTRVSAVLAFAFVVVGCGKKATTVALDLSAETNKAPAAGAPFSFLKDEGGKRLSELLPAETITELRASRPEATGPAAPKAPPAADLNVALGPAHEALPQVSLVKEDARKKPQPRMLPPEPPLVRHVYDLGAPRREELPVSPLTRVPSPDVNAALPVPILSQPLPDRASLDDPTVPFSTELVLTASPPERTNPAPAWFLNLPDPSEHRHVVRLRALPPEDSMLP